MLKDLATAAGARLCWNIIASGTRGNSSSPSSASLGPILRHSSVGFNQSLYLLMGFVGGPGIAILDVVRDLSMDFGPLARYDILVKHLLDVLDGHRLDILAEHHPEEPFEHHSEVQMNPMSITSCVGASAPFSYVPRNQPRLPAPVGPGLTDPSNVSLIAVTSS